MRDSKRFCVTRRRRTLVEAVDADAVVRLVDDPALTFLELGELSYGHWVETASGHRVTCVTPTAVCPDCHFAYALEDGCCRTAGQ